MSQLVTSQPATIEMMGVTLLPLLCPEKIWGCIGATSANAKAELNRSSQACEILTVTGISRREKLFNR
jgi:hypothetical protein